MKAINSLLVAAALTATGLAATMDVQAAGNRGASGGGHSGATWTGSGHRGGNWGGGHHGGHWGGGHRWGPRFGFYFGAPVLFGAYAWGYPYDYYYPRTVVVDRVLERYPASYPEGVMESAPRTTEVPMTQGGPTQVPTYMNYCDSAKAYYPKVTSCPEGWKFLPSR